jgi:hypothetical protein
MQYLQSQQLAFSRDGRTLIELDADAISIIEPGGGTTVRIAFTHVHAAVAFADQIWVAHGRAPQLSRITRDGRPLGRSAVLAEAEDAWLIAAPVGPAAAMWTARPRQMWIDEGGALTAQPAPSSDIVIPLTGRRWVTATGARVVAPSGLACELDAGARILGGAVIQDGTAAAMIVARAAGRELVVISLANGRPQLRQPIASAPVRVAVRRGLVAIRAELRRIALLDLRSGRVIGEISSGEDILDFALDPDGQRIALRGSMLEILPLREAQNRRVSAPVPDALEREFGIDQIFQLRYSISGMASRRWGSAIGEAERKQKNIELSTQRAHGVTKIIRDDMRSSPVFGPAHEHEPFGVGGGVDLGGGQAAPETRWRSRRCGRNSSRKRVHGIRKRPPQSSRSRSRRRSAPARIREARGASR